MAGQLLGYLRRLLSQPVAGASRDAVLLERFVRAHDAEAFAALVQRHQAMVNGTCLRLLGNVHDAEDVAQAAFLLLARKAASIRPPERLAAWLHGVARNLALKSRRAEFRRSVRETHAARPDASAGHSGPLDELSARELLAIIDEELRRLPEVYRLPLILCYLEGRSQDEIARQLGWTPGSVKGRLERGRARLRVRLARRGLAGLLFLETFQSPATASLPVACLVQAALAVANGQPPTGTGVSTKAALLAEQGLRNLTAAKIKSALLFLLIAGVTGTGVGALVQQSRTGRLGEVTHETATSPLREAKEALPITRTTDRFGDPLPEGALARFGSVRFDATWQSQIALSPDGKMLAVRGKIDRVVRILDTSTLKAIRSFEVAGKDAQDAPLAFSPDNKTLAVVHNRPAANGYSVHLYEVASGKELRRWQADGRMVNSFAFSPDSRTLVTGENFQFLRFWETATGRQRKVIEVIEFGGRVNAVGWSPDGRTLACVRNPPRNLGAFTLLLVHAGTGKEFGRFPLFNGSTSHPGVGPNALTFSRDGRLLAAATFQTTALLWDLNGLRAEQLVSEGRLPGGVLQEIWKDLASSDAAMAYAAIWKLVARPAAALGLLKEHLRPVATLTPAEAEQLGRLLHDVHSDRFPDRNKAIQELERLGARAEAGLKSVMAAKATQLETRNRAEKLLTKLQQAQLRELRAIEVLEHIGNGEARQILRQLGSGTPEAWLTREARSTLERLAHR